MGAFKWAGADPLAGPHQEILIDGRCIVGRARTAHWIQQSDLISAEHAVIAYTSLGWTLRDLSSTNGSWVDGVAISGEVVLVENAQVSFGHEENVWTFVDVSPPHARVKCRKSGTKYETLAGYLSLPATGQPEANLYQSEDGWILERGGQVHVVADSMTFTLPSGDYEVHLPRGVFSATSSTVVLSEGEQPLVLHFDVSFDEEHVAIQLSYQGKSLNLEHRSHSYLLLTLARRRERDQKDPHCPPQEAGWCETRELAEAFHASPEQLNLWVWRARKQVQELHPELASLVIERRPSLAVLRIGTPHLHIRRGDEPTLLLES